MSPTDLQRLVEAGRHQDVLTALHAAHADEVALFVRARVGGKPSANASRRSKGNG